jgi:eukaryotic-like serine/threonine-protein kinase
MPITPGTKLGPYEIVAFIGAGGMGEVYRARDSRLGRDVALKILPASFAADADRLRRFEQEARAVAALNHPNILAVHDFGQHEGSPFLVSELLEGESLHALLARGVPPQRKAIEYAVQIAQGLAAAHSKDIAHRDLKPDNIFITREGRVKILDFGLAKSVQKPARSEDATIATMASAGPATEQGVVVGTAGYMSPEQVRGGAVDCRTDIFSFGAVFYEMLTGKRAFKRDTAADTMAAILQEEPPELAETGRQIPPALDRIVRHCLEKSPDLRFQSARDLAFDLESMSTLTSSPALPAAKEKPKPRWWYAAGVAALVAIAALAGWMISSTLHPATGSQFHEITYRRGSVSDARYAADGQSIIYTAAWEGAKPELYTVAPNGVGGHALGIANARLLAVSKRGEIAVALAPIRATWLSSPGTLARTTDAGNAPRPEIENVVAADFTPDGSGLAIVRYQGTTQPCVLEYPVGKALYRAAAIDRIRFSPDGRYIALTAHDNPTDDRGILVILRSSGEKVVSSGIFGSLQGLAWSASGKEVWFTSPLESGEIHAITLSGKVRQPLAVPGRVYLFDISASGQLLVSQGVIRRGMAVAPNGAPPRDVSWLNFGFLRDISQDGKTILFEEEGNASVAYRIFVRDINGSPAVQIGEGYGGSLSRDKRWALGVKIVEDSYELWLLPTGAGTPRRVSPTDMLREYDATFLSDNRHFIYTGVEKGHQVRVYLEDIDSDTAKPISPEGVGGSVLSPDDKWVVTGVPSPTNVYENPGLFNIQDGHAEPIRGLKTDEPILGWAKDNQLYVQSTDSTPTLLHIEKLNPFTGARSAWRDLPMPAIGGITPEPAIISYDGSTYGYDYRVQLKDLYTVDGVR